MDFEFLLLIDDDDDDEKDSEPPSPHIDKKQIIGLVLGITAIIICLIIYFAI